MPDLFKRSARTTLSIRKHDVGSDLRKVLTARIEPMVRYLVSELAELVARRIDADLERVSEAVEVAISAFASASEPPDLPSRRKMHPQMEFDVPGACPACAYDDNPPAFVNLQPSKNFRMGNRYDVPAPTNDVRGGGTPSPGCAVPEPAVAAEQGSTSRRKCSICGEPGKLAKTCCVTHNVKPSPAPAQPNSDFLVARRYKTTGFEPLSTPPPPVRALKATPEVKAARMAVLRERSAQQPADKPLSSAGEDANPNADERWSKDEIDEEKASAEARKLTAELPDPISSWVV